MIVYCNTIEERNMLAENIYIYAATKKKTFRVMDLGFLDLTRQTLSRIFTYVPGATYAANDAFFQSNKVNRCFKTIYICQKKNCSSIDS